AVAAHVRVRPARFSSVGPLAQRVEHRAFNPADRVRVLGGPRVLTCGNGLANSRRSSRIRLSDNRSGRVPTGARQERLENSGLCRNLVGPVQRGETNPTVLNIHRLARVFRTSTSNLLANID